MAPFAVELAGLQTEAYVARLAQEQNWQALDALLGLQPDVRPVLSDRIAIPTTGPEQAAALIASLPQRRPDLVALQFGYGSQQQSLRAAVLGQFPALTLGPNYGSDTTRVQSAGPAASVALPLFNGNRGQVAIDRPRRRNCVRNTRRGWRPPREVRGRCWPISLCSSANSSKPGLASAPRARSLRR